MSRLTILLIMFLFVQGIAFGQNNREIVADYLNENKEALSLTSGDLSNWIVSSDYISKHNGVSHIHIQQRIDGIDVFNGVANFAIGKDQKVFHFGNNLVPDLNRKVNTRSFSLDSETAISKALRHLDVAADAIEKTEVTPAYFPENDQVKLSWHVVLHSKDHQHIYNLMVDGTNGDILDEWDQVLHCSFGETGFRQGQHTPHQHETSYQPSAARGGDAGLYGVFPTPVESPIHGARAVVSNPADPVASPFGWHDTNGEEGADFTITRGNNVRAYEDANNTNNPGYSPDGGANLIFDYPFDIESQALDNQDAALTNLFYWNNIIHDIMYQYGFDEPSGNFQANNYGNGGSGGDDVRAEGLDGSGLNNANFSTQNDGIAPRMQMYLWAGEQEYLTINTPSGIAGTYVTSEASFGPDIPTSPLTADLVLYDDATFFPNDACEAPVNGSELSGKIAVIDRRDCTFVDKIQRAQDAGAIAVIMVNNVEGSPVTMGGTSATINIPSVMVSIEDGALIKEQLNNGATVNGTIVDAGEGSPERDGSFDNGIITHEYGHGISTRLVGGRFNSFCLNNTEQMGEGWSDWFGMMLTMNMDLPNPVYRPIGTYAISEDIDEFGIRPAPYDTSFTVNSYTYGDLGNEEVSIPHGVGFVWSTMLWDLTWALIDEYGFDPDLYNGTGGNNIAMQLVIEGLKMTACRPGFVAARDGILAADEATYDGANQCLIWEVFARRGLGVSAFQGNVNNVNDGVEAFDIPTLCTAENPLVADFLVSATASCTGAFDFADESTGDPTAWAWDFGDGNTSIEQNPSHQYTASGTYTVTLTVSNDDGDDTFERTNLVTVDLPVTPTTAATVGACTGETVSLSATSPHTTVWYDATGNVVSTDGLFTTDVLTADAAFAVQDEVTINDETCVSEAVDVYVTVSSAAFSLSATDLSVAFTDQSSNATSWLWNFGDGSTSTSQSPVHEYAAPGAYNVTLTVNGSCTATVTVDVVASAIENEFTASGIELMPNPASRSTTLKVGISLPANAVINMIGVDGKVAESKILERRDRSVKLDISGLASGLYHILVYDGEELIIQEKLVVTHQ